jgi:hypothetical protein
VGYLLYESFFLWGGVQSTAALVLASQGKIDYQTFLFCNVGEFEKACELEQIIIDRMQSLKPGDAAYFTRKLKPLKQATSSLIQESLFGEDDTCDSGYCFM